MNEQNVVVQTANQQFYEDIITGLRLKQKQLPAKYFYDCIGDEIFQEIMNCPEYYLTSCEQEILSAQSGSLIEFISAGKEPFDLVELGAGDCQKTIPLLRDLLVTETDFTYKPIDISANIINYLEATLPGLLPGLNLCGLNGDYFDMLQYTAANSQNRKVILCLGANIGNMTVSEGFGFCNELRDYLSPGDLVVMGFDLKKDPRVIRAAYNDKQGITRKFNLNLLTRINRELGAGFDLNDFEHYCSYDPESGACKSFLICLKDVEVNVADERIVFTKDECIWMEISQKYTIEMIDQLADRSGFRPLGYLFDGKKWFTDAVWQAC